MPRIYLDHAATTPIRPEAAAAVVEGMRMWANPSSPHAEGRAARAALEDARARIAAALGWDGHVILTSGASEAIDIALHRAKREGTMVSAVEHDAVLRRTPGAERLPVKPIVFDDDDEEPEGGTVDLDYLADALRRADQPLVAIQHVNSETGAVQDIAAIAAMVAEAGGTLLCDCAQSAGKIDLPRADLMVVSAHKLGGPPGIGALLVRDLALLEPSGGQEFGYRGGTENLPGVLGFAAAVEAATANSFVGEEGATDPMMDDLPRAMRNVGGVRVAECIGVGSSWIETLVMPELSSAAQLIRFDLAGFAVSAGSACSSGTMRTSHVLRALGFDEDTAGRAIRVSFGWTTTRAEVERFVQTWLSIADEARRRAA